MDVSEEPSMAGLFEKSKIIEISGTKIGIVGFIGKDADVINILLITLDYLPTSNFFFS